MASYNFQEVSTIKKDDVVEKIHQAQVMLEDIQNLWYIEDYEHVLDKMYHVRGLMANCINYIERYVLHQKPSVTLSKYDKLKPKEV